MNTNNHLIIDIGITLRKYRNKHKFTQQYLANCLDISRVTYRKWENNQVDFTITQLHRIADFYSVAVEEIIKRSYIRN